MNLEEFKLKYQKQPVIEYSNSVTETPLVSVCVQTYQHVKYIERCLKGILMQKTSFPFEILLGEDASTDGTRKICLEYAKKYPDKIKLFLHHRENNIKINGKPSGRFNFGFNLFNSKGKYIALCEGDDYWTDPLKLQKQVGFLESNNNIVICGTQTKKLNKENVLEEIFNTSFIEKNEVFYSRKDVLKKNPFDTCSVVFKNGQFPKELFLNYNAPDWILYLFLLKKGMGCILKDITAVYNYHGNGIASTLTHITYLQYRLHDRMLLMKNSKLIDKNIIKKAGIILIWNYIKQAIRWRKEFIIALYSNRKLIIKFILN
ncbi:glycosyl transferase family 2 [Lutibacter oceani]|uniref:Glycosyl transferase family 2 n=1 Tax=Lutibacter oceani TaxID=1853311 RepID=A0A3D9RT98_9FLAO|nr:glycosyltransferase family 2 protein [Lutibacter oceani]REE83097.1 glycosyl transferase family 2 [Lutibacter oceani]